jgi:HEAT repeat protein
MRMRIGVVLLLGLLVSGCSRQKSTDQLIQDLNSGEEKDRIIAARLLQDRGKDATRVVPALAKALKAEGSDVRWSAAIGLGYYGEEATEAIPKLKEAQHDRDARVREAARVALSRIDPERFSAEPKPRPTRQDDRIGLPHSRAGKGTAE